MSRITAGLTCFNAEQTVDRALQSALCQDWPDLEVVVVDDASTDGSWKIIEQYAKRDPRIKALRHDFNRGPAATRNTILESATGSIVTFFDDDDESLPKRIRAQYETLRNYEKTSGTCLVACYASGRRRYANGYELYMPAIGSKPEVPKGELVVDYLLFNGRKKAVFYGSGIPTCALMARSSTFRAVGGFDNSLHRVEDADFAIKLGLAGGHFVGCREHLYTQYATQAADKSAQENYRAELQLLDKYRDYLEERKRYGFARNWFAVRYHHFNNDHGRMLLALIRCWFDSPSLATRQLLTTVPVRVLHEWRMARTCR